MAALSRLSLLLSVHLIWRLDDAMVGDVERTAGWPRAKRRSPREVHEAAQASRGRSGAPTVRIFTHASRVASGQL